MSKIEELSDEIREKKMEFGDDYDTSLMEQELKKYNDKYNSTLEFGGVDFTNIGKPENKENKFNLFETINPFARIGGMLNRGIGDSIRNFDGRPGSRIKKEGINTYEESGGYTDTGDKKSNQKITVYPHDFSKRNKYRRNNNRSR